MVDFMYYGEVNVSQEQLPAILKIAEMLKIKGLADMPNVSGTTQIGEKDSRRSASPMSPAMRRKRLRKSSTGSGSGSTGKVQFSAFLIKNDMKFLTCSQLNHVGVDKVKFDFDWVEVEKKLSSLKKLMQL